MSSAISQLSGFSSVVNHRRLQLHAGFYSYTAKFRTGKVLNLMNSYGQGTKLSRSENKATPSYMENASISDSNESIKSHPILGATNGHVQEVMNRPTRAAKIHDFCFGIPFGGILLGGGLLGFILSRNRDTLSTGVLFGGTILALSTFSLKVWRQGKSSFPFIFGQAALSLILLCKNFQAYSSAQKLFPAGFNVAISAGMLCFYSYVVMSGGNPPPKKSKPSAAVGSSN